MDTDRYYKQYVNSFDDIKNHNDQYLNGVFNDSLFFNCKFPKVYNGIKNDLIEMNENNVVSIVYDLGDEKRRCTIGGLMHKDLFRSIEDYIAFNRLEFILFNIDPNKCDEGFEGPIIEYGEVTRRAQGFEFIHNCISDLVSTELCKELTKDYINFTMVDPIWGRECHMIKELNCIIKELID